MKGVSKGPRKTQQKSQSGLVVYDLRFTTRTYCNLAAHVVAQARSVVAPGDEYVHTARAMYHLWSRTIQVGMHSTFTSSYYQDWSLLLLSYTAVFIHHIAQCLPKYFDQINAISSILRLGGTSRSLQSLSQSLSCSRMSVGLLFYYLVTLRDRTHLENTPSLLTTAALVGIGPSARDGLNIT